MDAFEQYDALNAMLRQENDIRWLLAANTLARMMEEKHIFCHWEEGRQFVCAHFYWLLDNNMAREAAVLAWGFNKVNPHPQCVQDIDRCFTENHHLLVQGGSGLSKSFWITLRILLEWVRDPEYTTIRVASMSQAHLQDNLFSHLIDLYTTSVIPFPGESDKNLFIGLNPKVGYGCIRGITFPKDEKTTGRFLGFKMQNRLAPHPKFGGMSRIFVFLDEFNKMTPGVLGDLNSIESQIFDIDHVKIIAAYNPADISHVAYTVSAPKNGWGSVDAERDFEWDSKAWHVLRLDGMRCENVIKKQVIYKGFLTYQAFLGFLSKGDSSADYWTYGRGWWPMAGAYNTIFSRSLLTGCRNIPIFERDVVNLGSVDAAMINDRTVFTWARYGPAMGYVKPDGARVMFPPGQHRHLCSIEQQIEITGCKDEWELAQKIRDVAQQFGITPEWLVLDATGSMAALKNNLIRIMGAVLGLVWSEGATEKKILADDAEAANEAYQNLSSEMWFCAKMWIEAGIMHISPAVPEAPLFDELTSRRRREIKNGTGKAQVETKNEYRARGHSNSPDFSDSLIMIPALIRQRHAVLPGRETDSNVEEVPDQPQGYFDRIPGMPGRTTGKRQVQDNQVSLDEIGESSDFDLAQEYGGAGEGDESEEAEISWR